MTYERILQAAINDMIAGRRVAHCGNSTDPAKQGASAKQELDYIEFCQSYGEKGYDNPKRGILFANWNKFPRFIDELLERAGYAVEWSDEWIISSETGKAYRTSPNGYDWKPYYVLTDDADVVGGDEIESGDQLDWYVNEYLINDTSRANVFDIDLASLGFTRFDDTFETGWYPGQNDKPAQVFARIRRLHPNSDIVFSIDSVGQFDAHWSAWFREAQDND